MSKDIIPTIDDIKSYVKKLKDSGKKVDGSMLKILMQKYEGIYQQKNETKDVTKLVKKEVQVRDKKSGKLKYDESGDPVVEIREERVTEKVKVESGKLKLKINNYVNDENKICIIWNKETLIL